jgi:hypothetical protein
MVSKALPAHVQVLKETLVVLKDTLVLKETLALKETLVLKMPLRVSKEFAVIRSRGSPSKGFPVVRRRLVSC